MKIIKWALIAWSACASLLILLAFVAVKPTVKTVTHTFCAYGRVFVEFEETGFRWGTIMLDYNGRPIPCREDNDEDVKIENTI